MNYSLSHPTPSSAIIQFQLPVDQFRKQTEKKILEKKSKVSIKGFRPGKVPMDLVKKYFQGEAEDEVIQDFFKKNYHTVLETEKLTPLNQAVLSKLDTQGQDNVNIELTVDIIPRLQFDGVSSLNLQRKIHQVSADEIENLRQMKMEHLSTLVEDEEKVVKENSVIEAKSQVQLMTKGEPVRINDKSGDSIDIDFAKDDFYAAYKSHFVGMKLDEEKEVLIDLDENVKKQLGEGNEDAKLNITLKVLAISKRQMPSIDAELLEFYNSKDIEEWNGRLKKEVEDFWIDRSNNILFHDFCHKYLDANPISIPEFFYEKCKTDTDRHHVTHDVSEEFIVSAYLKNFGLENKMDSDYIFTKIRELTMLPDTPESQEYCARLLKNEDFMHRIMNKLTRDLVVEDLAKRFSIEDVITEEKF